MVVDTSAFLAIFLHEQEADRFSLAIYHDPTKLVSVAAIVEASIVLQKRFGHPQKTEIDGLIDRLSLAIAPIDLPQLQWARHAVETYGRGKHAAGLNFGDCFSYALAKTTAEPLLFKGDDFSKTDIVSAL